MLSARIFCSSLITVYRLLITDQYLLSSISFHPFTVHRLLITDNCILTPAFCRLKSYSRIDHHVEQIRDEGAGQHQHR